MSGFSEKVREIAGECLVTLVALPLIFGVLGFCVLVPVWGVYGWDAARPVALFTGPTLVVGAALCIGALRLQLLIDDRAHWKARAEQYRQSLEHERAQSAEVLRLAKRAERRAAKAAAHERRTREEALEDLRHARSYNRDVAYKPCQN